MTESTEPPRPIVLCVDDDPNMLAANARVLRLEPVQVVTTTSPREGLQILAATKIAVLVSDFEMPEMSGVELCASARAVSPDTIRILLTGRGTFDTAVSGINEGEIFRFLSKPAMPDVLRAQVRAAIERHKELLSSHADRDGERRRIELLRELEAEYPGITERDLDEDGRYAIDSHAWDRVTGLGLEPLAALCAAR
ncbi:MAG TPA: response regulator [Kofleriaceae bacterium]|nr:response regulator [Kofleriaceae bacterium]